MFRKALRYADRVLSLFEEWSLLVTVMGALLALFVSVVTRYTMTYTMTWPEELVREVILYTTFVGSAAAVKNRALIRIDAVPNLFPWLKKPLDYVNHAAVATFAIFVTIYGWQLVKLQFVTKQTTIILRIPQVILFSILPLMGVMMLLRLIQVITEDLTGQPVRK
ncbi:MAG: TRAP transporter small permease subunit [Proteobacteria bacterium]|nr:TRAP transporter small permease subunit [Pseudomonadota bacterium]